MIDIKGVPEVKAAALLFRDADRATRAGIQKEARAWGPELQRAISANARTTVDRRIAATAKVTASAKGLKAVVGSTGRLSGAPIREIVRQWEFGTFQPEQRAEYLSRSPKGKAVRVDRRVQRQVPHGDRQGRMVYPAVAQCTPDLVSRWVRAVCQAVTRG